MTSPMRRPVRRWLRLAWRAAVITAAAVSVAGCVGMPSSGPVGAISVSPQSTNVGGTVIQPFPAGPQPGESPSFIVQGFLAASANYPFNAAIARQYLVSSAARTWHPGWSVTVFTNFKSQLQPMSSLHGVKQAKVLAQGDVQSAFDGTGQFVSASASAPSEVPFNLVQVGGQWRISNPPARRLLTVPQFAEFYKAQDLYFYNPAVPTSQAQPLVPDSVFVPLGTSTTDLLNNLVTALLPSSTQPKSSLLKNAAQTFPPGTTLASSVAQAGSTAVVNLAGLKKQPLAVLEQVSAQLVWTLASPRAGPGAPIQSVELERNGTPWVPPRTICGMTENRSQVQNQATYSCYNPYPSQSAIFSFISHGQVWSRCASEAIVQRGLVGPVVPVLGSTAASLQSCRGANVPTGFTHPQSSGSPGSNAACGTSTRAVVSPDGQYVACYSAAAGELFAGLVTGTTLKPVKGIGQGVTALCWDSNHNLWVAESGDVYLVPDPDTDQAAQVSSAPGGVTDLSVAPDGVRIALIVKARSGSVIDLAAIIHNTQSSQGQHGFAAEILTLSQNLVHLSPGLADPQDLAWYDANDLVVLAGGSSDPMLSEVPVDGQASFGTQPALPGTESVTANSSLNALVIGMPGDQIEVSTGLEGPWQLLGVRGQNPSYPG